LDHEGARLFCFCCPSLSSNPQVSGWRSFSPRRAPSHDSGSTFRRVRTGRPRAGSLLEHRGSRPFGVTVTLASARGSVRHPSRVWTGNTGSAGPASAAAAGSVRRAQSRVTRNPGLRSWCSARCVLQVQVGVSWPGPGHQLIKMNLKSESGTAGRPGPAVTGHRDQRLRHWQGRAGPSRVCET
jgi:hypothetical protein